MYCVISGTVVLPPSRLFGHLMVNSVVRSVNVLSPHQGGFDYASQALCTLCPISHEDCLNSMQLSESLILIWRMNLGQLVKCHDL